MEAGTCRICSLWDFKTLKNIRNKEFKERKETETEWKHLMMSDSQTVTDPLFEGQNIQYVLSFALGNDAVANVSAEGTGERRGH